MSQIRILANDGIHPDGALLLSEAGYEVITERVEQQDLPAQLPDYDVVLVRSATKIRKDLMDVCPRLRIIGRGGVGLDNIDVDYARSRGIAVFNTPAASSKSVAELVFAHFFSLARSVHLANREMPVSGTTEFKALKKKYSRGVELSGKTIGIIGFGRIGRELAKIALGIGMYILPVDPYVESAEIDIKLAAAPNIRFAVELETVPLGEMLPRADFVSLHIPYLGEALLGTKEFEKMKTGAFLVNASRGGSIDEEALLSALESGKIAGAGLDVFEGEPTPKKELLSHPNISVSPHTGASTGEAQANIGRELAEKIIAHLEGS